MDVSIIIVNYNTKELISDCIQSIYEKTSGINYEIIVVDNASVDGSQQMIAQYFPTVKLIELNENIGFGRANNRAVKIAIGKYLFFLNSDTKLLNNAVKIFFDYIELHNSQDKIGAIGSLLLDKNYQITHSFGYLPQIQKDIISELKSIIVNIIIGKERYFKIKHRVYSTSKKGENKHFLTKNFFDVEYITGADLFVPKNIFMHLNGFDENIFMYYEESDIQKRMKDNGYSSIIIDGPKIQHFEGASFQDQRGKRTNTRRFYFDISRFYYYKKHFNTLTCFLYHTIYKSIQLLTLFDKSYSFKQRVKYLTFLRKLK